MTRPRPAEEADTRDRFGPDALIGQTRVTYSRYGDLCDAEPLPWWGLPLSGQSSREPSSWAVVIWPPPHRRARRTQLQLRSRPQARTAGAHDKRPNIVLVLMDDFSLELLATMPQAQRMRATGATYRNAHVVDSLCCPSRASIFTGRPPHQTGVLTNTPNDPADPIGGYRAFTRNGNAAKSFNVPLQKSGYATGFVGKYMNGYEMSTNYLGKHFAPAKVAGWDSFEAILGGGYHGWGFWSTWRDRTGMMRRPAHREAAAHRAGRQARPPLRDQRRLRSRRGLPAQASRRVEALLPRGRDLRSARPDDDRPTPTTPRSRRPSPTAPQRATRPAATAAPGAAAHSRCRT